MKKLVNLPILLSLFLIPSIASAELIIINGSAWDYEITGSARDNALADNEINLKTDLFLQDQTEGFFLAYIEHPVPIIPNVRLGSTSIKTTGSGTITRDFTYNGQDFSISDDITSELVLDHTEIALYYSVLDNMVGLDLGINVKFFDGRIKINTTGSGNVNEVFDDTIPLLYAALQVELPMSFHLSADLSYISFDGNTMTDLLLRLRYTTSFKLGIETGYRSLTFDLEDTTTNEYANVDVSGPFIGVNFAF